MIAEEKKEWIDTYDEGFIDGKDYLWFKLHDILFADNTDHIKIVAKLFRLLREERNKENG